MRYWRPVICKVVGIEIEDIKIGLLCCLDFTPVNYYSISKQEASSLLEDTYYSKDSIIRPGRSRLLEFEKKDGPGCLIETFFKNLDQEVK